jgi:hypothetical protein
MKTKMYRYPIGKPQSGRLVTLKDHVNPNDYIQHVIDIGYAAINVKLPSISTLERWDSNGTCKAIDGCIVEPDGVCPHGFPSWLILIGMI